MRRLLAILLPFALLADSAQGVMHINPKAYPHAFHDMMHHPTAAQVRAAGGSVLRALSTGASGTKDIAVIVVQFPPSSSDSSWITGCPNNSLSSCSRNIQNLGNIQNYFNSMKTYYSEVSYSKLSLNFWFFNETGGGAGSPGGDANLTAPYTMPNPMEYYGCGDEGEGCGTGVSVPASGANGNVLIHDALIAARAEHANLDNTHFEGLIVIHAGYGNETTGCNGPCSHGPNGDIWSIFYADDPGQPIIQSAGGGFTEGDVDPELENGTIISPLGVMCHEFGHSLGLPDLYNTSSSGGSSVNGSWELMDLGPYDNSGTNPSHMGAWDKTALGWISPTVATARVNTSLGYVETNPAALKIPVQNGLPEEYFLVEYRSTTDGGATFDKGIPGSGLLIWHIDDAITSARGLNAVAPNTPNTVNIGTPHYGVSIVPADGTNVGQTGGRSTNTFGNQSVFTSPTSNNFAAQPSGISLVNISGVGSATASMQVANFMVTAGQSIIKLINFPNPAGKNYPHPSGPDHTTFQMQATRPASDYGFNIYTLSGDLVRKVGKDDITLNLDRTADNKWVYEYTWDLTNGDGNTVAPGVYLYLGRADGVSKANKAVIIR